MSVLLPFPGRMHIVPTPRKPWAEAHFTAPSNLVGSNEVTITLESGFSMFWLQKNNTLALFLMPLMELCK